MESDNRYKHLFETSPYSIMILDMWGTIEDCNQSTIDMLGYSKKELIGRNRGDSIKERIRVRMITNLLGKMVLQSGFDQILPLLIKKRNNLSRLFQKI